MSSPSVRRVCFVTGTRAEFGLMRSVLAAIDAHPRLGLQIIATGMHLDASRGGTLAAIKADGWRIDAVVPWEKTGSPEELAIATGAAMCGIAAALQRLKSDVVLVVGDRVEAFAAAAAGAIGGRIVAHVHGGDRALGQVDDSLRHAITKLSHIHFPATKQSGRRIKMLGEEPGSVHVVGSPGIDGIVRQAAPFGDLVRYSPGLIRRNYALAVLHPVDADDLREEKRATELLAAIESAGIKQIVAIYPNNDPGSGGIVRAWSAAKARGRCMVLQNVPRRIFLGLLRDAAVLVGNSSAGIIEAGSFGTSVIDIGHRQKGRERSSKVREVGYSKRAIQTAVAAIWNDGRPLQSRGRNPYSGKGHAGTKIADILGHLPPSPKPVRKLIAY